MDAPACSYPVTVPCLERQPPPRYVSRNVTAKDQVDLTVHTWLPPKREAGQPVALLLHGIGLHGRPYAAIAAGFCRHGIVLAVPDLRGHGSSGGIRGDLADIAVLRGDLDRILDHLQEQLPDSPVILLGESMGGLLAAHYALASQKRLAGLALLAPAFLVHHTRFRTPGNIAQILFSMRIPISTREHLEPSTRDPGFIAARLADPWAVNEVYPSYLMKLGMLGMEWPQAASDLKLPLYIGIPGNDQIIDSRVSRWVFVRAQAPPEEKRWQEWPDACHTLFWDPIAPDLVETLAQWSLRVTAP
jgi:alpha-beta hydrolase superfamily lysophospholipase